MIPPVSDADKLAAWDAYYRRPDDLAHVPIVTVEEIARRDPGTTLILDALQRVLETDRARCASRAAGVP